MSSIEKDHFPHHVAEQNPTGVQPDHEVDTNHEAAVEKRRRFRLRLIATGAISAVAAVAAVAGGVFASDNDPASQAPTPTTAPEHPGPEGLVASTPETPTKKSLETFTAKDIPFYTPDNKTYTGIGEYIEKVASVDESEASTSSEAVKVFFTEKLPNIIDTNATPEAKAAYDAFDNPTQEHRDDTPLYVENRVGFLPTVAESLITENPDPGTYQLKISEFQELLTRHHAIAVYDNETSTSGEKRQRGAVQVDQEIDNYDPKTQSGDMTLWWSFPNMSTGSKTNSFAAAAQMTLEKGKWKFKALNIQPQPKK